MGRRLRYLANHVGLDNPSKGNAFIARQSWSNNYKRNVVLAYIHYATFYRLIWRMPFYKREDREFKAPKEEHVNRIISCSKLKGALFYSIVRDRGHAPC